MCESFEIDRIKPERVELGDLLAFYPNADVDNIQKIITNKKEFSDLASISTEKLYSKYYSKNEELFVIDTAGISDTRLTENDRTDRYPTWSPDGRSIAWSSSVQIYLMNFDGSNQRRFDYGRFPAWTPDSKYIIYCNANDDFSKEVLYKIDINRENKIQLTF